MDRVLNQIRRMYSDNGKNDRCFHEQELKLKEAHERLYSATTELVRSCENLNAAAFAACVIEKKIH